MLCPKNENELDLTMIRALTLLICTFLFTSSLHAQDADSTAVSDSTKSKLDEKADLPLLADRKLEYTATEGSWISLDVSPDGSQIVFDLLGDLYLLPINGGQADTLTNGMPYDSQPRFSPDGSKIIYKSDEKGGEGIWTVSLDTLREKKQLTKGKNDHYESPNWSPDGDFYVFTKGKGRFGPSKLYMAHIDGGSGTELMEVGTRTKVMGPVFSPDGRYIWHTRRQGDWNYNAEFPQMQVNKYDRETGKNYSRTSRYGSGVRPTPSPDGKWLVYGTRFETETGLILRDLEDSSERWLAYPVQRDNQEARSPRDAMPGMAFTPDSKNLIASYGGKIWRVPLDGSDAVAIPFEAEVDMPIGPKVEFEYEIEDSENFIAREIRDAVPSPDGARLTFTVLDRLYVMDYPDGTPKRLTNDDQVEAKPSWSPDGKEIAFVSWNEEEGHINKVSSEGGNSQRLTTKPGVYQETAWSPYDDRIIAVRGPARAYLESTGPRASGARNDFVWVASTGGELTTIAPTAGRSLPHFSDAAKDRIFLFEGSKGLVSMRWDGTDEKEHLKITGKTRSGATDPNNPSSVVISPKGDLALAEINNEMYVVTIPLVGGKTPSISVADASGAAFPSWQLTDIGGQFPAWEINGRKVRWSIGNAHVVYDLDERKRIDEVIKAEKKAKEEEEKKKKKEEADSEDGDGEEEDGEDGDADSGEDADESNEAEEDDDDEKKDEEEDEGTKAYKPEEHRIEIEIPRDTPEGVVVLSGARLLTMNGREVIDRGQIIITNNRITAIGTDLDVPRGADIIDVTGKTIVPGFVDTHSHMWNAWGLHKASSWIYQANLAYGVTTTRDPQTATTDVLTYGDLVTAGELIGPRIYSTGPGIFGDYVTDPIRDLDHARDIMKRYSKYYDTKTIKMYMSGNRQQRQWVIIAAKEQEIMPTTEGGLSMEYNLTMLQDGYPAQEHSFPIFPLYSDVVKLTAYTGLTYTPTLLVSYGGPFGENYYYTRENPHDNVKLRTFTPHSEIDAKTRRRGPGNGPGPAGWFREEEHVFSRHAEIAKEIIELGGRIGVGSHGQLQGLGYHWELWSVASGGMNPYDALRAATILGAEGIGLHKEIGSLEVGKLADLVVLAGNPLDDIRNTNTITHVMKNGRLYLGDDLSEVWPRQVPADLPAQMDPPGDLKAGIKN